MKAYSGGEVVLLSFPYVGATVAKRRPALVVLDTGDDDIVVARITSQLRQATLDVEITQWQQAGLLQPSVVRVHKLATVEKQLVERQIGRLTPANWAKAKEALQGLWTAT